MPLPPPTPSLHPSVRSLSYGAVRGYYRHEAILGMLLTQPVRSLDFLVRALLSVALYELEDERTPEYAVVDAAVQTAPRPPTPRARRGSSMRCCAAICASARRWTRRSRRNRPLGMPRRSGSADRLRADWPVRWTQLLAAGDAQAPMWLRVNSRRATADEYVERLRDGWDRRPRAAPECPRLWCWIRPAKCRTLPGFAEGLVSVQDLGAQCVAFPLGLAPGQRVLDACAAPGGKTALIAEREPNLKQAGGGRHRSAAARPRPRESGSRRTCAPRSSAAMRRALRPGGTASRSIAYCSTRPARAWG